jgi:hypothetical protein
MRIVDCVDLAKLALLRLKVPLSLAPGARAGGTCSPTGASATPSAEPVLQGRMGLHGAGCWPSPFWQNTTLRDQMNLVREAEGSQKTPNFVLGVARCQGLAARGAWPRQPAGVALPMWARWRSLTGNGALTARAADPASGHLCQVSAQVIGPGRASAGPAVGGGRSTDGGLPAPGAPHRRYSSLQVAPGAAHAGLGGRRWKRYRMTAPAAA